MKKNYTVFAILFIGIMSSFAQPIVNSTDFTANYSTDIYYYDGDASALSPGNAGPNQVWDFSALTLTLSEAMSTVPVASAPFANSFPTANYCWKNTSSNSINPSYSYITITPTYFESIGWSNNESFENLTNTQTIFKFPYIYGTVISDTHQSINDEFPIVTTTTYDAYGTLITPFGTYIDVVRRKEEEDGYTSYIWFKTNPFSIVMNGEFSSTDAYISVWKNTTGLSVNKNDKGKSVSLVPNPTNGQLNLQFSAVTILDRIIITDLTGKTVLLQTQPANQINVQGLAKGMYILQAFSGNEKFQNKFVKE